MEEQHVKLNDGLGHVRFKGSLQAHVYFDNQQTCEVKKNNCQEIEILCKM